MAQTTLDTYLRLPRRRYFSALEWHAVAIGSIAAAVLIIGYGFNFEPLQTIIPGFPTMKARTASAFMALSVSFLLSLRESQRSRWGSAGIAALLLLAFGMKAAAFPVNAWLPASYHAPPAAISAPISDTSSCQRWAPPWS